MRNLPRWRSRIRSARDDEAVVSVVVDYEAAWAPGDIARLPRNCWPGRVRDRDDVAAWAVHLAREELKVADDTDGHVLLHCLAAVFSEAAVRLTQVSLEASLLGPRTDPGSE